MMSHGHHGMDHQEHLMHHPKKPMEHAHGGHGDHMAMIRDFKKRFWISLVLTLPVLFLSPVIQQFLHLGKLLSFPGDIYVLFVLSSIIFFYGGWPFLKGLALYTQETIDEMMFRMIDYRSHAERRQIFERTLMEAS